MDRTQLRITTLGDILARDFRAGAILDRYGLDYCCGGTRTLDEGCAQRGVSVDAVLSDLEALGPVSPERPADDLGVLMDHIVDRHHAYVRTAIPVIQAHLSKVTAAHGARHTELRSIEREFMSLARDLSLHMIKEEQVLFPHIRALAAADVAGGPPPPDMFGTVQNPIRMMEVEHQEAGNGVSIIRELSGNYVPPADACETYRLVLEELDAFAQDLHTHVHLENNVLFPKAVELEAKVERTTRGLPCAQPG